MTRNIIKTLFVMCVITMFLILYMFFIQPIMTDVKEKEYDYHFQVLVEENIIDESYDNFEKELKESALKKNVFVEIIPVKKDEKITSFIEKGIYQKVDGIACSMKGSTVSEKLVKKAKANEVALIDYGMNPYNYKSVYSVGADEKQLAKLAITNICDNTKKSDKTLILLNSNGKKNKVINKIIKNELEKIYKTNGRNVKNIRFQYIDKDKYSIESYVTDILEEYKKYESIVVLDSRISSIVGNVIYNNDIEGLDKKIVLAFGANDDSRTYLKKGVFTTVLDIDGIDMASKLLSALLDIKNKVKVRNYITDLKIYNYDKGKVVSKSYEVEEN